MSQSSKLHIYLWLMQESSVYHRLNNEFCGICSHQLKSARKQRSNLKKKKIINLYIIAAQNNKDAVCFLYKQEPENIKSQLPVFITDEHGVQILWVALLIIKLYHAICCNKRLFPSHLSSSARLDGQQQSFLFSWDSRWPPCDN